MVQMNSFEHIRDSKYVKSSQKDQTPKPISSLYDTSGAQWQISNAQCVLVYGTWTMYYKSLHFKIIYDSSVNWMTMLKGLIFQSSACIIKQHIWGSLMGILNEGKTLHCYVPEQTLLHSTTSVRSITQDYNINIRPTILAYSIKQKTLVVQIKFWVKVDNLLCYSQCVPTFGIDRRETDQSTSYAFHVNLPCQSIPISPQANTFPQI